MLNSCAGGSERLHANKHTAECYTASVPVSKPWDFSSPYTEVSFSPSLTLFHCSYTASQTLDTPSNSFPDFYYFSRCKTMLKLSKLCSNLIGTVDIEICLLLLLCKAWGVQLRWVMVFESQFAWCTWQECSYKDYSRTTDLKITTDSWWWCYLITNAICVIS